jgi:DNA-cytosine methyltransferase
MGKAGSIGIGRPSGRPAKVTVDKIGKTDENMVDDSSFARQVAKRARRAHSPEPPPQPRPGSSITVGSDCAGYGSDFIALKLLGIDATLVFVAEKDAGKRELLRAAHKELDFNNIIVYHDITKRDNDEAPYVDVYFTGAPCQAWSQAGLKQGLEDTLHRGVVIFHSIEYVRCKRPRVVVVENVKGLTFGENKKVLADIVGALSDLGYTVEFKVLNTKDHGIPHSRPRLYIVAIRTRFLAKCIEFPKRLRVQAGLASFIDIDDSRPSKDCPDTKCFTEAMLKAKDKHSQKTLSSSLVVIDVASSVNYSISMIGVVPCITKSRGRP